MKASTTLVLASVLVESWRTKFSPSDLACGGLEGRHDDALASVPSIFAVKRGNWNVEDRGRAVDGF